MDLIAEIRSESECDNQEIMQVAQSEEAANTIDASDVVNAAGATDSIDSENVGNDGEFLQEDLGASAENLPTTEIVASDSSSSPAIADDLINGCSQETGVENELDAEMVSEDELPPPNLKPTIDDAEDLSDEELPGPARAELPADTEVVSEDELPSNKVKRKADESHEIDNTNEDIDTPKKRAKTELDSNYHTYIHLIVEMSLTIFVETFKLQTITEKKTYLKIATKRYKKNHYPS